MKRLFTLSIIFMMLFSLAACSSKDSATNSDNTNSPSTEQANPPSPAEQANASSPTEKASDISPTEQASDISPTEKASDLSPIKAIVSLDYASEELLSKKDTFDEFVDAGSEYQVKVVFTANTAVREFKYVELNYSDAGQDSDTISFDIAKDLYCIDELSPERPLVVTMLLDGAIPNRGISYVDENGTTRHFTISMSGKDNSLLLTEF